MNPMEKVAWFELIVSVSAVAIASLLFPWLGPRASGAFGILGLLAFSIIFVRKRGNQIMYDERDREIERRATSIGVGSAWMTLFTTLIVAGLWSNYSHINAVSSQFLNWLIWVQFAICYGMKGLVSVIMYRRQRHAT
jgi:cytochrome bd-type quinol oxidase subunit 2